MKKLNVALTFLFVLGHIAGLCQTTIQFEKIPDWLYQGVQFEMEHVKLPHIPDHRISLSEFDAKADGLIKNTIYIQEAIDQLGDHGGGTLVLPHGLWLTGPIELRSNLRIHLEEGAVLLFSRDLDDYSLLQTSFEGLETYRNQSPISGKNLENVAITGHGIIDGGGDAWRFVKKSKMTAGQWKDLVGSGGVVSEDGELWFPSQESMKGYKASTEFNTPSFQTKEEFEQVKDFLRPVMISLVNCRRVLLDGPTFQNSPAWNIHPLLCVDLTVRNIKVRNPWYSQNGDGLDLESCRKAVVYNSTFDVGDDAICIKSGKNEAGRERGVPTEKVIIRNNVVYHGHGGVVVGSEMSGGVRDIHVSECTFMGTDVGIRFKSTRGRGGLVENIWFSNIQMTDIPADAVRFNLFYTGQAPVLEEDTEFEGDDLDIPPVSEETPSFRNIYMDSIMVNGAGQAVYLLGLPEMNLQNISISNSIFKSQIGLTAIDVDGLKIRDTKFLSDKKYQMKFYNTKNVKLQGISPDVKIQLLGPETENIHLDKGDFKQPDHQVHLGKNTKSDAYIIN